MCVIEGLCWDEGLPVSGDGCLTCDPEENNQAWTLIAQETACDSGDYCVVAEVCDMGVCQGGQPRSCDDGLSCTTDTCSSDIESCIQTLDEDHCLIDGVCKDEGDLNAPGGCKTCDPSFATDAWVPAPSGISCSDQNPCTLDDTCSEGVCESGPQKDCADELSCTVDTCDSETGLCQHALDGGHCELDGACVAAGELSPENPCLALSLIHI